MKILFFDYWLKGISNFERLVPEFHRHGCSDLKMVHVGSWKNPQDGIVFEHNGFKSYDITYYHTSNLYKVLKREKPDVLVILNLYYLMDKALVVFCKRLGIKVIYLAHGRMGSFTESFSNYLKQDLRKGFLKKIRKDTIATLYNYWLSTVLSKKPLRFFRSMYALIANPVSMTLNSRYTDELCVDKMLLYYESDKEDYINNRHFPDNEKIKVVGNPEIDAFFNARIDNKELFLKSIGVETSDYLLYLDDGYVQARIMTRRDWYDLLDVYADICKRDKLTLVVKLHPRTNVQDHQEFFASRGIIAITQVDFRNIVEHALAVTSMMSTTISMALIANRRVISPRWGSFESLAKSYPENVIKYVSTPEEFEANLLDTMPTNQNPNYLKESIGIVDGCSIKRIVTEILSC